MPPSRGLPSMKTSTRSFRKYSLGLNLTLHPVTRLLRDTHHEPHFFIRAVSYITLCYRLHQVMTPATASECRVKKKHKTEYLAKTGFNKGNRRQNVCSGGSNTPPTRPNPPWGGSNNQVAEDNRQDKYSARQTPGH